jgi:hypothetical protein
VLPASRGWQTFGMDEVQALVAEQVAYYRAHAPDYDDAYLGKDWDRCVEELPITGDVLELACGTGHWTPPTPAGRAVVWDHRDPAWGRHAALPCADRSPAERPDVPT